jgi:hypothetical protein
VHLALSPAVRAKDDLPGPCRADDSTILDNDSFFDRAASTVHLFRATGVNYHDVVVATVESLSESPVPPYSLAGCCAPHARQPQSRSGSIRGGMYDNSSAPNPPGRRAT